MSRRKWNLMKRWCPVCRVDSWVVADPRGFDRGCSYRWTTALEILIRLSKP